MAIVHYNFRIYSIRRHSVYSFQGGRRLFTQNKYVHVTMPQSSPQISCTSPPPQAGSPKPVRSHTFSNGSPSPMKSWKGVGPSVSHGVSDMTTDFSDDDLSEEVDGASEAGPFGSLQELRNNPGERVGG